ncbi:MAG: CHAT domain-containing protein [Candidatus Sulfopaludibacter sp.]|nr:CHAT domain-containing protein [Candidatus Sulfopaludibacter sp.]
MDPAVPDWLQVLADETFAECGVAGFFDARSDLRNPQTVQSLHDEVLRILYADSGRAQRLAAAASWLAADLDDPGSRALALRASGHVNYAGSRYQEAIRCYQEALDVFTALGSDIEAGRTLLSGMQPLSYLGRYDDACLWAARAREIFRRLGDNLRLARVASNEGNILYRQDRYAEALTLYEEAYTTLSRIGEHRDVAAVLSNIAVCNSSLSRFVQALECYRTAREYCERHGLSVLVAGADYNVAYLHYLQGDFLRAIELYRKSREHCRKVGDRYHAALCDLDEAEIYLELNLNREASWLAEQAEQRFQSLDMAYEGAKARVSRAIAASRRGQFQVAARLFRNAREVFAHEQNGLWPALIDLYRAILFERENKDREAARLCRRALPVLAASALPGPPALAELLQCRLLLKKDQVSHARERAIQAQARLQIAGTPSLRFHAHFVRGQVEEQASDECAAWRAYEAARLEIETLRSRLWGDEPKVAFLKDKLAVYESLVKLRLAGSPADAFGLIQQAKSRTLSDLISQPPCTMEQSGQIEETRCRLNSLYRHMERLALSAQNRGAAQLESLKSSVRDCENTLVNLVTANPSTAGGADDALSLDAIQASLPPRAILLEYYVFKGELCVCLLDGSGLEIVPLGGVEEIRTRMRLLRFQIRKARLESDPGGTADCHLRELYADLVAPVAGRLTRANHLIFAPHDLLHHLPFHALRGPDGYLIDAFTVSYAPSATVFALCSGRRPGFGTESLVLGLPDRRAPHIESEARMAAVALPEARLFLGEEATEEVLRRIGASARFIHIASHGLFRRDNPLFSAIRLEGSHLTLLDLYHLPISAELVTLSGCSTGLSVVVGGDELVGLMRGLLLAGAHGVMASLWDVNDSSTTRFMKRFYACMTGAPHKAAALQCAMRELRQECPHPYHWAPFVLAGRYTPAR